MEERNKGQKKGGKKGKRVKKRKRGRCVIDARFRSSLMVISGERSHFRSMRIARVARLASCICS